MYLTRHSANLLVNFYLILHERVNLTENVRTKWLCYDSTIHRVYCLHLEPAIPLSANHYYFETYAVCQTWNVV